MKHIITTFGVAMFATWIPFLGEEAAHLAITVLLFSMGAHILTFSWLWILRLLSWQPRCPEINIGE